MIRTEDLTKNFKQFIAVDHVSLHVKKGDIYGFLGLNGAGKTTTLEMLLGLVRPTKGRAYLFNTAVQLKNYHLWEKVGYLLDAPYSYPELTVEENLKMFAKLRQVNKPNQVRKTIENLHLQAYSAVKASQLSLGNQVRLGIARALLHEPKLLILDEPVNGLDPAGMSDIRHLLQDLAYNKGVTILMSSHLLDEVAKIATTIGIIHEGQLLEEIATNQLTDQLNKRLIIKTSKENRAQEILLAHNFTTELMDEKELIISDSKAYHQPEKIAELLVREDIPLQHLSVDEESLEDYFLRMINERSPIKERSL